MDIDKERAQTTYNEDLEGFDLLQQTLDDAKDYGASNGEEGVLAKPEDLWAQLMQIIGVAI